MTIDSTECKGCLEKFKVSSEEIEQIIKEMNTEKYDIVEKKKYKKRLGACQNCSFLQDKTTCRQDGNLVQIKAKLKSKNCPHPENNKWEKL